MSNLIRFIKEEEGVTAIEYALIAAITIFSIVAISATLKANLSEMWDEIANSVGVSNS